MAAGAIHEVIVQRAEGRVGTALRDKYTLERLLGVGGSAAVYAGRHRNGMRVAVKVLHPEIAEIAGARRRFLREGYIANRIEHPGVVRVIDDDEDADGTAFLAMELLEGHTLEHEWAGQRLLVSRVTSIAQEILEILEAAGSAGVVHRDLKPENVFVMTGESGARPPSLKILDFGIARLLEHPRSTPTGDAIGSAEFVAPELARGRAGEADVRADLYAVAAMMFSFLTGRFVHETKNPLERMILTATKPAPALRAIAPEIGEALANVVDIGLSFDRAHRWANAREMLAALRGAS